MAKILVLSYGCEPGKGSEAGIGWQWANHLSEQHEVFVLTHPRGRAAIQAQLASDPRPRLHVKFVELPRFLDPWRLVPGEQAIQLRYIMWQAAAYRAARKIVATEDIDLVHHVSWTTMTGPTLGWALGKPFIWGPVGSGQRAPLQMRRFLGLKGWAREAIRNTQVATVTLNPLARAAAGRATLAFASNHDTYDRLQKLGAGPIRLQPDAAVDESWLLPEAPTGSQPRSRHHRLGEPDDGSQITRTGCRGIRPSTRRPGRGTVVYWRRSSHRRDTRPCRQAGGSERCKVLGLGRA